MGRVIVGETIRALRGFLLAPLSLAIWVPLFIWIGQILTGGWPDLRMIGTIPMALIFGYAGMVAFGVPLYAITRLLHNAPLVAFVFACLVGAFASLVTPQLLEASRTIAIGNLETLASHPDMWIGPISFAGAATGASFWLLVQ